MFWFEPAPSPRVTQHTVRSLGRVYHIREWLGRDEPVSTLQKSGKLWASINIRRVITINSKGVTEDKESWSETAAGTPGGCRRLRGHTRRFSRHTRRLQEVHQETAAGIPGGCSRHTRRLQEVEGGTPGGGSLL